jgi:DNA-binding MarR family transcriptional regulator
VAVLANRLSRSASRFYRKEFGIGVVEWRLLMFIGHARETRANCICSETDLDKGAVSRSIGVLQGMGIVSVKEDGADGRRNNVALTAKGWALHNRLVPVAIERQRELVDGLTAAEIEIFKDLIDRLQANVADGDPAPDDSPQERLLPRGPRLGPAAAGTGCAGRIRPGAAPPPEGADRASSGLPRTCRLRRVPPLSLRPLESLRTVPQ